MATATETMLQLPQFEAFHRVCGLPLVERALAKSASTYSRVKSSHQLINWILSTAENSLSNATKQAVPFAVPIAMKLEIPIHFVDYTLCIGLDKIEESVPIVKDSPEQIMEKGYMFALQTVRPAVSTITYANDLIITQASVLKERSWNRANQILDSYYGTAAIQGFDNTVLVVDKLLDRYFPATGNEEFVEPASVEEDKLLHTLQTIGKLSNKAARRVYTNVIRNLQTVNKYAVKTYINTVVEFLHIAQCLHVINNKVHKFTSPIKNKNDS
ncbi:lipid storage droplets surface-binding protein 2 [Chelonus insularis]|uniref:lipid storage droplets surface-binding protein 2 n=1 Tax=Chelonus insularis TaxID=460826 RepID=UPI00158C02BB|nr:lipid storage droplets surface-binding protein 2 [Chelonus insularis]